MIVPERAAARQAAMKLKEPGGRPGAAGGPAPAAVGTGAEVAAGGDQAEAPKEGKPRGKKVCSVIHATTITELCYESETAHEVMIEMAYDSLYDHLSKIGSL